MIWDKKSIEILEDKVNSGITLKSILREISIECILEDKDSPSFPFYIQGKSYIDPRLKAAFINYKFSDEEILQTLHFKNNPLDLLRSLSGPEYITFYESEIVRIHREKRFNLFHTPHRNVGTTNTIIFCVIDYIINSYDKSVVVYIPDKNLKKLVDIYKEIPFYLKPGIISMTDGNKYVNIKFDNGNRILLTNSFGRTSMNYDYLFIDDISRLENNIFNYFLPMASMRNDTQILAYCSDKKIFDNIKFSILNKYDLSSLTRDDKLNKLI